MTKHKIQYFLLSLFIIIFPFTVAKKSQSQVINPSNITLESAQTAYQSGHYSEAISILQKLTEQDLNPEELATVHSHIASIYWYLGKAGKAVRAWNESVNIYRNHLKSEKSELLAATIIDLATAYNDLGQPIFSIPLLNEAITLASSQQLNQIKPFAYFALGNAYIIEGNYSDATTAYSTSLEYIKSSVRNEKIDNLILTTYGNLSRAYSQQAFITHQQISSASELGLDTKQLQEQAQQYQKLALDFAQTAVSFVENTSTSLAKAQALLQLTKLSPDNATQLKQAHNILLELPNSAAKVYALLNLAQQLNHNSLPILIEAVESAQKLNNNRVASFALGALGHYYELQHQYPEAESWTQQALMAAEAAQAFDSSYRWYWQMGRILTKTGQTKSAIAPYRSAITSLQAIRGDLVQASRTRTLNFQEQIEPIYRQLLQLLLSQNLSEDNIDDILIIRDLLQVSELENFFQDDCLSLDPNLDPLATLQQTNSVIVNSIILQQGTYLIWQFPNGKRTVHAINIAQPELEQLAQQWQLSLKNFKNDNYLFLSQKLYRLFFNPDIESELAKINPSQLVFINDGILRNVPMSALHDGQQFLIEKYAISTSLGLNLQLKEKDSFNKEVLAFGLSLKTDNFSSLPYVKEELNQLKQIVPKNKQFFNEDFTASNFFKQTGSTKFAVIHFATHGWFSGFLESSFLQAYSSQISLPGLEEALVQHNLTFPNDPIDLIVFSACNTATGNTRATLGLSGVSIRSGVNSVLGSLWTIRDREAVSLISDFYRHWITLDSSKAESLRQAQLSFINSPNNHPAIWSAMLLITN